MTYLPFRPLLLATLSVLILAPGCKEAEQYDPAIHGPAVGGAGGAPGLPGAGGTGASGGSSPRGETDGPAGPSPRGETDGPTGPSPGVFTCTAGSPCTVPGQPCLVGMTQCDDRGSATCLQTTKFQANGSPCGAGDTSVCLDGVCSACQSGTDCPLDGQPCKRGVIECATGKPECTEAGPAPNGTGCGQGKVCQGGTCGACAAGDPCLPENPCHDGTLDCTAGAACKDTGTAKSAGSVCGSGKVCNAAGACVACSAGMTCDLPGQPCKTGKIDCSSGAPTCVASGNAANGKDCGSGKVCRDGSCETCNNGMTCTPTNKCHAGSLACSTGTPECMDTGRNLANGAMCGNNQYCNNGTCAACTPNTNCTPDNNRCKTGKTSCDTGVSECRDTGNVPDGRDCEAGKYCRSGSCLEKRARGESCDQGYECESRSCVSGRCCNSGEKFCDGQCRSNDYCCNGEEKRCTNNCGTGGVARCQNGSPGTCSVANTCCGDSRCTNNCGESGNRPCNGTSFGACPVPNRQCCGSSCSNGFACVNGNCSTTRCANSSQIICNGRCISADCCRDSDCGSGRECEGGNCREVCGGLEEPCCEPNRTCKSGLHCSRDLVRCFPCGAAGQRCCPGEKKCNDGLVCPGDFCGLPSAAVP